MDYIHSRSPLSEISITVLARIHTTTFRILFQVRASSVLNSEANEVEAASKGGKTDERHADTVSHAISRRVFGQERVRGNDATNCNASF